MVEFVLYRPLLSEKEAEREIEGEEEDKEQKDAEEGYEEKDAEDQKFAQEDTQVEVI